VLSFKNIKYVILSCHNNKQVVLLDKNTKYVILSCHNTNFLSYHGGVPDHQPLGCAEFERAVRYRCNAAGKVGAEAHAAAASELVELVERYGSTLEPSGSTNAGLAHVRRCVWAGLEVLCRTDAVGSASLGKCVVKLADEKPHPPLLLLRLVHECARQRPALAQLVCTQVMPLLVRNGIWLERARWQGFLLLAKRNLGPRPPHALSALLSLPPQPLKQLCPLVPAAKPALAAYAQQQQQSMSIGHGPSALGGGMITQKVSVMT